MDTVVSGTNKEFGNLKSFTHTRASAFKVGPAPDIPDGTNSILKLTVVIQSQCSSPIQSNRSNLGLNPSCLTSKIMNLSGPQFPSFLCKKLQVDP